MLPLAELTQSHIWWILIWLCVFWSSRWREWTVWVLIEKCVLAYGIIINGERCLKEKKIQSFVAELMNREDDYNAHCAKLVALMLYFRLPMLAVLSWLSSLGGTIFNPPLVFSSGFGFSLGLPPKSLFLPPGDVYKVQIVRANWDFTYLS